MTRFVLDHSVCMRWLFGDGNALSLQYASKVLDAATSEQAWGDTLALARRHSLTAYDASYLELALREGLPLATLDESLRTAADRAGVPAV